MAEEITVSDKDLTKFFIRGIIFFIIGVMAIFYIIVAIMSRGRVWINTIIFGLCIGVGIIAIPFRLNGIILYFVAPKKANKMIAKKKGVSEKKDYMDLKWLEKQYYDLNKSIQDIADDQHVSMMTIKKWIDKINRDSKHRNEVEKTR